MRYLRRGMTGKKGIYCVSVDEIAEDVSLASHHGCHRACFQLVFGRVNGSHFWLTLLVCEVWLNVCQRRTAV
jgi:hypothetical protein